MQKRSTNLIKKLSENLKDILRLISITHNVSALRLYIKEVPDLHEPLIVHLGDWESDVDDHFEMIPQNYHLQDEEICAQIRVDKVHRVKFYRRLPLTNQSHVQIGHLSIVDRKDRNFTNSETTSLELLTKQIAKEIVDYDKTVAMTLLNKQTNLAKRNLKAVTTRLVSILDNLEVGVVVEDEQHNIIHANEALIQIFGLNASPTEIIGQSIFEIAEKVQFLMDKSNDFLKTMDLMFEQKEKVLRQEFILTDGRIIERDYMPLSGQGIDQIAGHMWQFRDVTFYHKARQEALTASKMKSEFLANMSHEIRTPLNGVVGMIDLLKETKLNPKQMDYVDTIKTSTNSLMEIINDILDFSKIEAGKVEIETVEFSLIEMLKDLGSLMSPTAKKKNLNFSILVAENTEDLYIGDPFRIKQVLFNLVSNSLKFTSQGGITIKISEYYREGILASLRFEVEDTGIGMNEEHQRKLFQPFTQADASTTRKFGGTGLGLSICKRIIEMMSGEIGVKSEVGHGSKFWFTLSLPLQVQKDVVLTSAKQIQEYNKTNPELNRSLRVLVAEDNFINQKVISEMLYRLGHQVELAQNGALALDLAQKSSFDIILMDCQMPEMDGYQATQALRKIENLKSLPIIALTANSMKGDREKCLEAGMTDYLAKPIQFELLKNIIAKNIFGLSQYDSEHINQSTLEDLGNIGGENSEDLVISLIDTFLVNTPNSITTLNRAIQEKDIKTLHMISHNLKSNAGLLGAHKLSTICFELEKHTREKDQYDTKTASSMLKKIDEEFKITTLELEKHRANLKLKKSA